MKGKLQKLSTQLQGDLYYDTTMRTLYATDASAYREMPLAVSIPKSKKDILTLIDFSLSSNEKRLWVIDLSTNTIVFNSLVAHGRNTGDEFAKSFSNSAESFKSSLGFYSTGEIYNGKHGKSLKLDGRGSS